MKYEEVSWYSERLSRYMKIRIYGHYGEPIVAFPCQDGHSDDLANNGMIDVLAPFIEEGKIKLFCVDSNDDETVSSKSWDKAHAAYKLEMYHQYFIYEALPFIYDNMGGYCEPLLIGMSMGGSHAANQFFRRPELYSGFIGLSGKYELASFFDNYINEDVYNNSPCHFLSNMPKDHPWIEIYNRKVMITCIGKGRFEYLVSDSNYWLKQIADEKGINIDMNFWDENSVHDWESWYYQLPYFLNKIL